MSVPPRILVTVGSSQDLPALDVAADLGAVLQRSLHGVFVEEEALWRLAALPFACDVALSSAISRPLRPARLEQELRQQALRLRRLVEARAALHSLAWSFEVLRGSLLRVAMEAALESDVLVVGRSIARPETGGHAAGPILVWVDGGPAALRALDAAAALVQLRERPLLVVTPPGGPGPEQERRIRQLVAALGGESAAAGLSRADPDELALAARVQRASLLIVGEGGPMAGDAALARLLARAGAPVVVVR